MVMVRTPITTICHLIFNYLHLYIVIYQLKLLHYIATINTYIYQLLYNSIL